ncbi:helix-turn-helix transcriptional regulator [Rhabdobacter roseus]|uniref:AraC-like DNA-binding protein n=1 Tax=Rhabdobacter roseus TaxID=1655419 RepID=A0A840TSV5_9BACT|nr:helix-turn-helix domain-containing protein [Rhabdobacter roseus]MBB5286374.1 AraC-like DNA-binding protein [Rhabdobacter roseus]
MDFFDAYPPSEALRPYIESYAIIKFTEPMSYNVLPNQVLVMGIYPDGLLTSTQGTSAVEVRAELFGLHDHWRSFHMQPSEFVTIHFTALGAGTFFKVPLHELFNGSSALEAFVSASTLEELTERFVLAPTQAEKVRVLDHFFTTRLLHTSPDPLVQGALCFIYESQGVLPMSELASQLHISQSRLEKRFRSQVGTSPKKYASLVRLHTLLHHHQPDVPLTQYAYELGYFDQAHFARDLKAFSGVSPKALFRSMKSISAFRVYPNGVYPNE